MLLVGAALCAILATVVAARVERSASAGFGPLRPVLVVSDPLAAGEALGSSSLQSSVVLRRVPEVFVPPGTLFDPVGANGRSPLIDLPPGTYLQEHLLGPVGSGDTAPGMQGRRPVEVSVSGAGALTVGESSDGGIPVDVVVSTQPELGAGRGGRAVVVARRVPLLRLAKPGGPGEAWKATLAVSGDQALRLIAAESSGRIIRLLPLKIISG